MPADERNRRPARGFEAVDQAVEPMGFAAYLDLVGGLADVRAFKRRAFELLALEPGSRVLDLGCGLADDAREIAARIQPAGRAVGVDLSLALLGLARRRGSPACLSLAGGDGERLAFRDESFDACHADRVLQHLERPGRAVAEFARVCRPGGRIVLSEPDWQTLAVDLEDRELVRKVVDRLCDLVRNGWIGRQLPRLCRQAGLQVVAVEGKALVLDNLALAEEVLGLESAVLEAYEQTRLSGEEVASWLTSLRRAATAGELFIAVTAFTVCACRPDRVPP